MVPWLFVQVSFVALILFLAYQQHSKRKARFRLPPGPKPLPIIGNFLDLPPKGEPEFLHWLKHKDTYGTISSVTVMGLTLVIFHDKEAAQVIMGKKAQKTSGRPQFNFASLCGFENFLLTHQYNDTYRKHRKLVNQQVGTKSLSASFNPVQEKEALQFVLRTFNDPDNVTRHLKAQAAAIILQTTYGYSIERKKADPLVNVIEHAMEHLSLAFVPLSWLVDAVPAINLLPDGFPGTSYKETAREWKVVNEAAAEIPYSFVRQQMAKGTHRPSYVSNLLQQSIANNANDPNLALQEEEAIKWTAVSLYAAGSETTVAILTSFILAIVMFPEVQRRAQEEIDRVVRSDRLPSFEDRDKLPYINGIVKEAWRWNPAGPMGLAHRSEEDIIYKDYLIPKGAYLVPAIWWFLHDPKDYSDPDVYMPERYLEPLNEPDPSDLVFGYGRRSCAGRFFADASVFITVAQTLAVFQISKTKDAQGNEIDPKLEAIPGMLNRPKKFEFKIAPRSPYHADLIRRIEAEQDLEESDSGFLNISTA